MLSAHREENIDIEKNFTISAKANPHLRQNYDFRTNGEDQSQRMLNALEPGTVLPIHRHTKSLET